MRTHMPKFLLDLDISSNGRVDQICLSWGTPSVGECSVGVRALMLAVLEEAIQSFLSPDRRVREEAERWIANPRGHWPFSFVVVCDTLGLQVNAARLALQRLREQESPHKPLGRSRPNVRRVGRLPSRKSA